MPPTKLYWPETRAEFNRLEAEETERYLPLVRKLQLHQLMDLNAALGVAIKEIKEAAAKEDVRRGHRPPGTKIGR